MAETAEDRLLYLLKSRGALTAAEAGAALNITTAGAQQQLSRLAGLALAAAEDRRQGRGRPRRYWRLTEKGHARFPDRHSDLTLEILQSTRAVFGADGLEQLIRHREAATLEAYRQEMEGVGPIEDRLETLAGIRSREGYMAGWSAVAAGHWVFFENHCPICAAASQCQGLCRSELAVFRAVLGDDVRVERTEHITAGARRCAYNVRLAKASDGGHARVTSAE